MSVDCDFATMEWHCCLPKGHEGDHESRSLREPMSTMSERARKKLSELQFADIQHVFQTTNYITGGSSTFSTQTIKTSELMASFAEKESLDRVIEECADIANIANMIADKVAQAKKLERK